MSLNEIAAIVIIVLTGTWLSLALFLLWCIQSTLVSMDNLLRTLVIILAGHERRLSPEQLQALQPINPDEKTHIIFPESSKLR